MTSAALLCADGDCERRWVRTVDGDRWCMFHPNDEPPILDAKGRPVNARTGKPTLPQPTVVPKHLRPAPPPLVEDLEVPVEVAALEAGDLLALHPGPGVVPPQASVSALPPRGQAPTSEVVRVPPPEVEQALCALEEQLERTLDEVATMRALVREVRTAYEAPPPEPAPAPVVVKKPRQISPEGRERMRESGRRLGELQRARAAERKAPQ